MISIQNRRLKDWFANEYELEYFPAIADTAVPFAVICPGGGYSIVSTHVEGVPYAKALNRKGITAFVLRYHTREKGHFPVPLDELARALREILQDAEKYNVNPNDYTLWGSSAGGHLAASFCTEQFGYKHYGLPKPTALILAYPVITLGEQTHSGTRENLLGKNANESMIRSLSIEKQVSKSFPPTFVWNSAADKSVPPVNSQLLKDALEHEQIMCRYICYPQGEHGIGLGQGTICEGWFDEALAFWEKARNQT